MRNAVGAWTRLVRHQTRFQRLRRLFATLGSLCRQLKAQGRVSSLQSSVNDAIDANSTSLEDNWVVLVLGLARVQRLRRLWHVLGVFLRARKACGRIA